MEVEYACQWHCVTRSEKDVYFDYTCTLVHLSFLARQAFLHEGGLVAYRPGAFTSLDLGLSRDFGSEYGPFEVQMWIEFVNHNDVELIFFCADVFSFCLPTKVFKFGQVTVSLSSYLFNVLCPPSVHSNPFF